MKLEESKQLNITINSSKTNENLWSKAFHKFRKDTFGMVGFVVVFIYFLISCGVWAGLIGTQWEETTDEMWSSPSTEFWCGTNRNGQDVLERAIYGTRVAFEVGFFVAVLSTIIGAILGGFSGYFSGGLVDRIIMWIYGTLESIPFYLFVAAIGFALPDNIYSMHVAMISVMWVQTCTIIRGEFIKIKSQEYVEAAHAIGVPTHKIIFKHIMPNTYHLLLVNATIIFVTAIKTEVILSFLGLGVKEGTSWGLMFSASAEEVAGGIYNSFITATLFMFILVLAFNIFSDAIQDALDPKKI